MSNIFSDVNCKHSFITMQFLQSKLCKYVSTILKILGNTLVFYHFIADIDYILNKILCAYSSNFTS